MSVSEGVAILNPLGSSTVIKSKWEVVSHENIGTANWRVAIRDVNTGEVKTGVYPFNLDGKVYELECQPGTWVIASCGGYKIESSWIGQTTEQVYKLKGTGEIIKIQEKVYYLMYPTYYGKDIPIANQLTRVDSYGGSLRGQSPEGVGYSDVPTPILYTCTVVYNKVVPNTITMDSLIALEASLVFPIKFIYKGRTFIRMTDIHPIIRLDGNAYVLKDGAPNYLELI